MLKRRRLDAGFSLIELMLALLFTALLMAGMARVFKASLGTFRTNLDRSTSMRSSRWSLDILKNDLDLCGSFWSPSVVQYPKNLGNPGSADDNNTSANRSAFQIACNSGVTNPDGVRSDSLYMYYDSVFPVEGNISTTGGPMKGGGSKHSSSSANAGSAAGLTYSITFPVQGMAEKVQPGVRLYLLAFDSKGEFYPDVVATATGNTPGSTSVTVTLDTELGNTKDGSSRGIRPGRWSAAESGSRVLLVNPGRMIRYQVQNRVLDPSDSTPIPCLVREEGAFVPGSAFTPDTALTTIIAEHVDAMKLNLRVNPTSTWIGSLGGQSTWQAMVTKINSDLTSYGRSNFKNISNNPTWFRDVPCQVRLDLTVRSAKARAEYSADGTTAAYGKQTTTMIISPRHFGLSYN